MAGWRKSAPPDYQLPDDYPGGPDCLWLWEVECRQCCRGWQGEPGTAFDAPGVSIAIKLPAVRARSPARTDRDGGRAACAGAPCLAVSAAETAGATSGHPAGSSANAWQFVQPSARRGTGWRFPD